MTPEIATAIVLALGGASIIPKIIDGFKVWRSGKDQEEKARNRSALGRLALADERADNEASYRRRVEEYASGLRRLLIDWGYPEDKLPPWPVRPGKVRT